MGISGPMILSTRRAPAQPPSAPARGCDTIRSVSYRKESHSPAESPPPAPPQPRRGRPRDAALEQRIVATVLALLGEKGYDSISIEEVARRSGASKASLYRRWSSKRDMVLAALRSGPAQDGAGEAVDTGSLREDLLELCRRLDRTMRRTDARTAMLLLEAGLEDPELCAAIETAVGPTGARLPRAVLEAAEARGELPPGADPFVFEEVVGSALLLRRTNGLAADASYLEALVEAIVLPGLRASAALGRPLPAGIFSGAPTPAPLPTAPPHQHPSEETP